MSDDEIEVLGSKHPVEQRKILFHDISVSISNFLSHLNNLDVERFFLSTETFFTFPQF